MTAVTADASRAADLGLGDPVPARTGGPAAADRSLAAARPGRTIRSWPLLVLAAPAAAEVWSGWVGIAQKTGFGLVSPLPGIWPSLHLDTAITLPVGVEAYAAYALRAWLAREDSISARTRRFAKWSAICFLRARHGRAGRLPPAGSGRDGTGTMGDHHDRVLPPGPGPGHGDHAGAHAPRRRRSRGTSRQPGRRTSRRAVYGLVPRGRARRPAGREPGGLGYGPDGRPSGSGESLTQHSSVAPSSTGHPVLDHARPQKEQALRVARELAGAGRPVSRRTLRSGGVKGSNEALNALARMINAELMNEGTILP